MTVATGGRVGNLPVDMTSFVGRRREIVNVRALFQRSRLVTIAGSGGVGKTRLAVKVGTDARSAFPDGIRLVHLSEHRDHMHFPDALAAAVGIEAQTHCPVEQIADHLAGRNLLLIVDGCEQTTHGTALDIEKLLLRCPDLRILAASREVLGIGGESVFVLSPLSVPDPPWTSSVQGLSSYDSVALFLARARIADPGFTLTEDNKAAVATICHRLEGIPLSIELAASLLRAFPPEQVARQLAVGGELRGGNRRGNPIRHRSLRSCMEWSYQLCTQQEKSAWAMLSVFADGFELDAAEGVCAENLNTSEVLAAVTGLVHKSVLIRDEIDGVVRFRQLESVRMYGQTRLRRRDDCGALARRHRDWYVKLAVTSNADWLSTRQSTRMVRLRREMRNLDAALAYCFSDHREVGVGVVMINALRRVWVASGQLATTRYWLRVARESQSESGSTTLISLLCNEATIAGWQDSFDEARGLVAHARELMTRSADRMSGRLVANAAGQSALAEGKAAAATSHFREALDGLSTSDDLALRIEVALGLGMASAHCGDSQFAKGNFEDVLTMTEAAGESVDRAQALAGLGLVICLQEPRRAVALVESGLRISQQLQSPFTTSRCLEAAAGVWEMTGRPVDAAVLLGAAEAALDRRSPADESNLLDVRRQCRPAMDRIRRSIGDSTFADAYRYGRSLTVAESIGLALNEGKPTGRSAKAVRGGLTSREWQVAELVQQGLTNRKIADTLVISQRTAQGHVERILTKLGFRSRTQIAAWTSETRNMPACGLRPRRLPLGRL